MRSLNERINESFVEEKKVEKYRPLEVTENKDITSEKEFRSWGETVLKKAFGDEYDEKKAKETLDGIVKGMDGEDWGEAVGKLSSGLGEELEEEDAEDLDEEKKKKKKFKKVAESEEDEDVDESKKEVDEESDDPGDKVKASKSIKDIAEESDDPTDKVSDGKKIK